MNSKIFKRYIDKAVKREIKIAFRDSLTKDIIHLINNLNKDLLKASDSSITQRERHDWGWVRNYLNAAKYDLSKEIQGHGKGNVVSAIDRIEQASDKLTQVNNQNTNASRLTNKLSKIYDLSIRLLIDKTRNEQP